MMKPTKTLIIASTLALAGITVHADHRLIDLSPALEFERATDQLKKHVTREIRLRHGHRGNRLYVELLRTVNHLEDFGDKARKYRRRPDLLCVLKAKSDPHVVNARRLGRAARMPRDFWVEMRRVETNLAMLDTNHGFRPRHRGEITRDRYRETSARPVRRIPRNPYSAQHSTRDRYPDETRRARSLRPDRRIAVRFH